MVDERPIPQTNGPWDLLMYMIRQFPNIAVLAMLVGGGFYGYILLLEEKNNAESALRESQVRIHELEKEAIGALNRANEKELEATKTLEQAKTEALASVQDKQINTAKEVQSLVASQISSMQSLEGLRKATADLLGQEIERLKKEREIERSRLTQLEIELDNSELGVAIKRIETAFEANEYDIKSRIDDLLGSFNYNDDDARGLLENKAKSMENLKVRAAIQYALSIKSNGNWENSQDLLSTLKELPADEAADVVIKLDINRRTDVRIWNVLSEFIGSLILDYTFDDYKITSIAQFYSGSFSQAPILQSEEFDTQYDWEIVVRIIGIISSSIKDESDLTYKGAASALQALSNFELAASHVWGQRALDSNNLSRDEKASILRTLENLTEELTILENPPSQSLIEFWTSENLSQRADEYQSNGTNEDYRWTY